MKQGFNGFLLLFLVGLTLPALAPADVALPSDGAVTAAQLLASPDGILPGGVVHLAKGLLGALSTTEIPSSPLSLQGRGSTMPDDLMISSSGVGDDDPSWNPTPNYPDHGPDTDEGSIIVPCMPVLEPPPMTDEAPPDHPFEPPPLNRAPQSVPLEPPPPGTHVPFSAAALMVSGADPSAMAASQDTPDPQYTVLDCDKLREYFDANVPVVSLKPGEHLTMSGASFYLPTASQPLGTPKDINDLSMPGFFQVPNGASLTLQDVTVVLSKEGLTALMTNLGQKTSAWPYSTTISVGNTIRMHNYTTRALAAGGSSDPSVAGGEVHWNEVIIWCQDYGIMYPPVSTDVVTDISQLDTESLAILGEYRTRPCTLFLSLAADISVPWDGSWVPAQILDGLLMVLLGNPQRTTTLDLGGMQGAWYKNPPRAFQYPPILNAANVAHMYDVTLINLPHSVHPSSASDLLTISLQTFGMDRTIKPDAPSLAVGRSTLVVPDQEIAFLERLLQSNGGADVASLFAVFNVQLPPGSLPAGELQVTELTIGSQVRLSNCTLLSASRYSALPGARALLPQSREWPPELLHGDADRAAQWGPLGISFALGLQDAFANLDSTCGPLPNTFPITILKNRDDQSILSVASEDMSDSILISSGGAQAPASECIVAGLPQQLGGGRTFSNLQGAIGRVEVLRPITLRNLVLYNLAPGGMYPLGVRGSGGSPAAPQLTGADAAWTNSSLPLWFFRVAREASPMLVLDNVTLVVSENEWRALAAAVLLQHEPGALAAPDRQQQRRLRTVEPKQFGSAAIRHEHHLRDEGLEANPNVARALRHRSATRKLQQLAAGDPGVPTSPTPDPGLPPGDEAAFASVAAPDGEDIVIPAPSPPPSPPPYSDATRAALLAFAAASKPLSYDYSSGMLVLAVARHYGWTGSNVTVTYKMPPDAPSNATLLWYPPFILPYTDLADMDVNVSVDFLSPANPPPAGSEGGVGGGAEPAQPLTPLPLALPPQPYLNSLQSHAPPPKFSSSGGRPAWVVPVSSSLSAFFGILAVLMLAVLITAHVKALRRQHAASKGAYDCTPKPACGSSSDRCASGSNGLSSDPTDSLAVVLSGSTAPFEGQSSKEDGAGSSLTAREANRRVISRVLMASAGAATGAEGQLQQPGQQAGSSGKQQGTDQSPSSECVDNTTYLKEMQAYYSKARDVAVGVAAEAQTAQGSTGKSRPSLGAPRTFTHEVDAVKAELRDPDLEVHSMLGCGAFGVVYGGVWRGLPAAVKTLVVSDVTVGREGRARHRAVLEAAISMSLAHPNIVATYAYDLKPLVQEPLPALRDLSTSTASGSAVSGFGSSEEGADAFKLYIVQEYCNGGTLRQALEHGMAGSVRAGGLLQALALRLALDVACGMRHVHSCRIVHGDLKPDNVLLVNGPRAAHDGEECTAGAAGSLAPGQAQQPQNDVARLTAKVADFGLSLPLPEGATHASNLFHGTPTYQAPEVAVGGQLSPRADVWSFGVLLLELYYGCTLGDISSMQAGAGHVGAPRQEDRDQLQALQPTLVKDMHASGHQAFAETVTACLAADAHSRPAFEDIVARLQQVLHDDEQKQ